MYPRNNASPPPIAVGSVVQISDGAVQTTGASARVYSGSWAAAAGTLACDTTSGIWYYTPTQGETNVESFMVAVYKASCLPACVTVVTSKSGSAGYAGVDWGQVINPTTTVGLSGTTVKTATDVETDTADIQSRLPASLTGGGNIKADLDTIKTQTVTCAAGVTVGVYVGGTGAAALETTAQAILADTGTDGVVVASGGITAASFGAGAIDAAALAADAGNELADAILLRNVSNVEGSAGEHTLCTVVLAMLEHSISGTTLTIKRTDGTTTHATKTLTTNASAEPITAIT